MGRSNFTFRLGTGERVRGERAAAKLQMPVGTLARALFNTGVDKVLEEAAVAVREAHRVLEEDDVSQQDDGI